MERHGRVREARLHQGEVENNVHFVDPNHNIIGREAFLAMVADTQQTGYTARRDMHRRP